ncbi:membrane protein [Marivivens niveibacter]|uniref:Membrane protein n=1 Tax=Marivivens niveibacter TaxID=1930667 RepID=A0A251X2U2_9RHOB|nr:YitT family protein [Marivivens niveibacter]OUD10926.1 membrane protein [Marivivens niveibacter]
MTDPKTHSLIEDAQGILFGTFMASFGVLILTHLGFVTGQTAGLAIILSYATNWSFSAWFFIVNLPFYWLGYKRIGLRFMIKTFIAVALVTVITPILPMFISFENLNPIVGAILFGFCTGAALMALFRHGASLGGIGILALYIQEKTGFRAGWTQLLFDAALFSVAFGLRDFMTVVYSFLGALVVNLVIAINHRKDRYIAT